VRARAARNMVTQTELAEALGVSQVAVSRRLRGVVPFDVAELAAVAVLLGCEITELLPPPGYGDPLKEVRERNRAPSTTGRLERIHYALRDIPATVAPSVARGVRAA